MKVQILLDRANFSPGCIDGRMGPQTRSALRVWQRSMDRPVTGEIDEALRRRVVGESGLIAEYTIDTNDTFGLAPVPSSWEGKSHVPVLAHETVLERLAERHHTTERTLTELNPGVPWPNPPPGSVLHVPQVEPWQREQASKIVIHLAAHDMDVFDAAGKPIAHFPCSIAARVDKRPVGELHIVNAAANPNYTFDPDLFAGEPDAVGVAHRLLIPPGPNNPVGVAWLSLDRPGYGIHGTPHPEDIGKTESHGCFRLANWNARKLLGMVSIGMPVQVSE